MANTSSRYLYTAFAAILFLGLTISNTKQVMAQNCGAGLGDLASKCAQYVQRSGGKIPPSKGCCAVVKVINVPCFCKYVNPQVENMISMEKVVYVARSCGKPVQAGMKCGSYTVPPS